MGEEHQPWTCDPVTMRDGGGLCQDYNPWSVAFLALYMLMMGLLLVNILIAIFSEAWVSTIENRAQVATQNLLDVIIEESYSLPFATLNALFQFLFIVWLIIALPIAIVIYLIKSRHKCNNRRTKVGFESQKSKLVSKTNSPSFFSHVTGFIRLTLFPRMFPIGPKRD